MHSRENSRENWDHLRYVLAVAQAGSISQAARDLGVNHATVLRHIAAFEADAGTEIFAKSAKGYAVHGDRLRVIDAAREVETAMLAVTRILQRSRGPVRGQVRITSTDALCQTLLPAIIAQWQGRMAQLSVELLSNNAHVDFTRLRADITVRPALRLGDDMSGVVAAQLGFEVYAAPGCAHDRWLGLSGSLARSRAGLWMAENVALANINGAADSFVLLKEMAAVGLGQAVLPCVVGANDSRLQRRRGLVPDLATDIWVASHADLADVPRIKSVRRMLVAALARDAERLAGRN